MRRTVGRGARVVAGAILAGLIALACRREGPPAMATRVTEIPGVNTPGTFMDVVALSADGTLVATGERGGALKVWTLTSTPQGVTVGAPRQGITSLAFSPDGALLATIARQREIALRLWRDTGTGDWAQAASIPVGPCFALRFDATGAQLAVGCETEVQLLEVATRREVARLNNPHPEPVTAFDLAASGRRAITAGREGGVTAWEIGTGSVVRTFSVRGSRRKHGPPKGMEADTAWAVAVALTPDGCRAAAATIEGSLFVWDLETGAELLADVDNEGTGPPHGALRFLPDGRLLAPTGDRAGMRLVDVASKRSHVISTRGKAFHAVSVADDATRYAVLTSTLGDRSLSYTVDVWQITLLPLESSR